MHGRRLRTWRWEMPMAKYSSGTSPSFTWQLHAQTYCGASLGWWRGAATAGSKVRPPLLPLGAPAARPQRRARWRARSLGRIDSELRNRDIAMIIMIMAGPAQWPRAQFSLGARAVVDFSSETLSGVVCIYYDKSPTHDIIGNAKDMIIKNNW